MNLEDLLSQQPDTVEEPFNPLTAGPHVGIGALLPALLSGGLASLLGNPGAAAGAGAAAVPLSNLSPRLSAATQRFDAGRQRLTQALQRAKHLQSRTERLLKTPTLPNSIN